ncbi:MAG: Asp-tRNA(Asn)/Glu-tRNA(Gln) amidotransferase subunit GatB [Myxococcales bacterium]|nr:Asp-tRNA(Asn)/Glu-tRNA(Gln) amidotransferase subunit GatB [Myxococcales bacterium]
MLVTALPAPTTVAYEAVIGLEVHAQLRTRTKIFCGCPTDFGAAANAHVCPVCLGLPGALPVLNAEAVQMAVRAGLATGCEVQARSVFARKNYFYPDLPKGYQISQADQPVCVAGHLDIGDACRLDINDGASGAPRRIGITRIHLEEDAGKSVHGEGGVHASFINLNRAGVPLIEIVSEPDLRTSEEAVTYLRELRAILVYLGVCDGNLDQGSFRCDANVSVRPVGQQRLGTRCEIKNMNSFRSVRDAIDYEIARQTALCRVGERIAQQTRLWNQELARTEPMRSKEESHDYRYFPDPDLLPLRIDEAVFRALAATLPELPAQKRTRLQRDLGLSAAVAATLCEEPQRVDRFEAALGTNPDPKQASALAHFLMAQVAGALNRMEQRSWDDVAAAMPELLTLCERWRSGGLSNKMLAEVLQQAFLSENPLPDALLAAMAQAGSVVRDEGAVQAAVDQVLAAHPKELQRYRGGQTQALGFFIGQVMRRLAGKGDAALVTDVLKRRLDG